MHASLTVYVAIPASRQTFFSATGETVNRCERGHIGTLDAKFCQECGKKFQLEPMEEHSAQFAKVCSDYGWESPAAGFNALLGYTTSRWIAKCTDSGQSVDFQILLTPINVEGAYEGNEAQVFGLAIRIANLHSFGEGGMTDKVLELPLGGFQAEAATLREIAALLGVEGEPALYPQVNIG